MENNENRGKTRKKDFDVIVIDKTQDPVVFLCVVLSYCTKVVFLGMRTQIKFLEGVHVYIFFFNVLNLVNKSISSCTIRRP